MGVPVRGHFFAKIRSAKANITKFKSLEIYALYGNSCKAEETSLRFQRNMQDGDIDYKLHMTTPHTEVPITSVAGCIVIMPW